MNEYEICFFIRKISAAIDYKGGASEKIVTDEVKHFIEVCLKNDIELICKINENKYNDKPF